METTHSNEVVLESLFPQDIAVFTNNASRCEMYRRESENIRGRYKCVLPKELKKAQPNFRIPNNKVACEVRHDRHMEEN